MTKTLIKNVLFTLVDPKNQWTSHWKAVTTMKGYTVNKACTLGIFDTVKNESGINKKRKRYLIIIRHNASW